MNKLLTLAFAGLVTFASCSKERLIGTGAVTVEDRNPGPFHYITANGSTNVHVTKGPTYSVQVKGFANLLPRMETTVGGNTLTIGYKNVAGVTNDNVEVFVTTPTLETLTVNGSANIDVKGNFTTDVFNTYVSGSGNINIAQGTAKALGVDILGSGNVRAFGFVVADAGIYMSGSGTAEVNAVIHLKANVAGSGIVYYKGSPVIESYFSGSGKLISKP